MIIDDRNKLQDWLDQNDWFEDGYISRINLDSSIIEITLGLQTSGTYVAGEPKTLKEFIIKLHGVQTCTFDKSKFTPGYDWCIAHVELPENEFGLKFVTSSIFELTCETIEISEPKIIKTITKPWISDKGFFVTAYRSEIPKPQYWIDSLKDLGFNVGFRYYRGELKQINDIPYPDYSGYFIQRLDRITKTEMGIFFKSLKQEKNKIRLSIELEDKEIDSIWKALKRIISTWKGLQVNCGNVTFIDDDWNVYLERNILPEKLEKIKNVW
jgi:hypothetical protein